MTGRVAGRLAASGVLLVVLAACGQPESTQSAGSEAARRSAAPSASASMAASPPPRTPSPTPTPTEETATVVAVGDLAWCDGDEDDEVAALISELIAESDGTVLTLGDHVYPNGTREEFAECYDPAFGEFRDRTRPIVGNHEYHTDRAAPYWEYFGDAAGTPGEGWYSFDLGEWHIVALNSICDLVSCDEGSSQGEWLRADLSESSARCTLAMWHHPRYSSGPDGGHPEMRPLWEILDEAGGDVLLSGHAHIYERLVPLDWDGYNDDDGIRQFIVGTGGRSLYPFGDIEPASDFRTNEHFGVLEMTLLPESYEWRFVNIDGEVIDAGSAQCH